MELKLTNEQSAIITKALGGHSFFIEAFAGSGKEQPLTSKVLTSSGWKYMGDIKVGDKLCDTNNGFNSVIRIHKQGVKRVYEVHFSDGSIVECGLEHLWKVQSKEWSKEKGFRVLPLKAFKDKTLKDKNGYKYEVPLTKVAYETEVTLTMDPYLLGCFISDKSLCKINASNDLHSFKNELDKLDLLSTKSKDMFIPDDYMMASVDNRVKLLRGLMDGNGAVQDKDQVVYITSSTRLRDNIITLVKSLGGLCSYYVDNREGSDKYQVIIKFKARKSITSVIETDRYVEQQCLELDGNHLYITDGFTTTHNTSVLFFYLRYAIQKFPNKKHLLLSFNEHLQREYEQKINKFQLHSTVTATTIHKLSKRYTVDRPYVYVGTTKVSTTSLPKKPLNFIHGNDLSKYVTIPNNLSSWSLSQSMKEFCSSTDDWTPLMKNLFTNLLKDGKYTHDMYIKLFQLMIRAGQLDMPYDTVMLDEIQDTSQSLFSTFLRLPINQKIGTGDRHQSIYMFLLKDFNMSQTSVYRQSKRLSLTQSFRCSSEIAKKVDTYLLKRFMHEDTNTFKGVDNPDVSDKSTMYLTPTNNTVLLKAFDLAKLGKSFKFVDTWSNLTRDLRDIHWVLMHLHKYVGLTSKKAIKNVADKVVEEAKARDVTIYPRYLQDYLIEDLLSFNTEHSDITFSTFVEDYSTSSKTKSGMNLVNMLSQKKISVISFLKTIKENINNDSLTIISNVHKVKG